MISEYEWLRNFITEDIYVVKGQPPTPSPENTKDAGDTSDTETPTPIPPPSYRGQNKKNILVLVDKALEPDQEDLLVKILQSAGLKWEDIALIVWPDSQRADLIRTLGSHVVLSFGLDSDPWCDTVPYEISTANGLSHLQADSLSSIAGEVELKRKLWSALKTLFGV